MIRRARLVMGGGAAVLLVASVAFATLGGSRAASQVSTLPERIDDSTFWALTAQLSEPGGYFR